MARDRKCSPLALFAFIQKVVIEIGSSRNGFSEFRKTENDQKSTETKKNNFWTVLLETPKIGSKFHSKLVFTKIAIRINEPPLEKWLFIRKSCQEMRVRRRSRDLYITESCSFSWLISVASFDQKLFLLYFSSRMS